MLDICRIEKEMERLVGLPRIRPYRAPFMDVRETETSVLADIELPGVDKKDIELTIAPDRLQVQVEEMVERESDGTIARKAMKFYRAIALPAEVDAEQVVARYENGVLHIIMPKTRAARQKRIQIE